MSPPSPTWATLSVAYGSPLRTPPLISLILPGLSLTRALSSGRNTRDHGISRFSTHTPTLTLSPSGRNRSSTFCGTMPPMGAASAGGIKPKNKAKRITGALMFNLSHLLLLSNRNQMEKSTKFRKEGSVSLLASPSRCQKILFLVDLFISGGHH